MNVRRFLHQTGKFMEAVPLNSRFNRARNAANNSTNLTSKVMNMTNLSNKEPPLEVDTHFTKKFKVFDTYDPFDLSDAKVSIDKKLRRFPVNKKSKDPFEKYGIDPLNLYSMPALLSRFLTSTGQILSRTITGCNATNQKKLSIAIKRARCCGILSHVHRDSNFLPTRIL